MNKIIVTVFTPLYNRSKTIYKVYESLCKQTCYDFEWLLINDGSTDDSDSIVRKIIEEHHLLFPISYIVKANEGLTRTINQGLDLAKGKLFFRLDSDDMALPDAIQKILENYPLIKDDETLCGVTFLSQILNGQVNGRHPFCKIQRCDFATYRDKYQATGDRAEVMKIDVYRNFKYPEISGEKFCPEGVVWNRIAQQYDTLYIPCAIYVKGDYDDSITSSIYQHLKNNSRGATLYYNEIINNSRFSFYYRFMNAIKYYRYVLYAKAPLFKNIPLSMWMAFPLGMIVSLYDFIKSKI